MIERAEGAGQGAVSRRRFIQATGAAAGIAAIGAKTLRAAVAPSERIRVGFIGPGRRGFGAHVKTLARLRKEGAAIDLVAVNDVYKTNVEQAVDFIVAETGVRPAANRLTVA